MPFATGNLPVLTVNLKVQIAFEGSMAKSLILTSPFACLLFPLSARVSNRPSGCVCSGNVPHTASLRSVAIALTGQTL